MNQIEKVCLSVVLGVSALVLAILLADFWQRSKVPQENPAAIQPNVSIAPEQDTEVAAGLDAETQGLIKERARVNDHEYRIKKLEAEVRTLNQIVRGIREMRIGDGIGSEPQQPPETKNEFD